MHDGIGKSFLIVLHTLFLAWPHSIRGRQYPIGSPKVNIRRHICSLGNRPWSQRYELDPEQYVCLNRFFPLESNTLYVKYCAPIPETEMPLVIIILLL